MYMEGEVTAEVYEKLFPGLLLHLIYVLED